MMLFMLLLAFGLIAASCATPPPTTDAWWGAGCKDSSATGRTISDLVFSGTPNLVGNAAMQNSTDGSCAGTRLLATVVRSNQGLVPASNLCRSLGDGNEAFRLIDLGYAGAPSDGWLCFTVAG
jgi:hypothetical protein